MLYNVKQERPLYTIKVKGKAQQIRIGKDIIADNDSVFLLRSNTENVTWVAKVSSRNYTNYIRITSLIKNRPEQIDVINIGKRGEIGSTRQLEENEIDITEVIQKDKFAFIENTDNFITIYKFPKGPAITLPRIIKLNSDLAWLVGFYLAEGNKTLSGIGLSNCEINLVKMSKEIIDKYFNIGADEWVVVVRSSNMLTINRNKIKDTLNINKIYIGYESKARRNSFEIRINNIILAAVLKSFIKRSMNLILCDKELALEFIKGYESGDGSVIQRGNQLYGISIVSKEGLYADYLIQAFRCVYGIEPRIRKSKNIYTEISVSNVTLMTDFIIDGHFACYPDQYRKLLSGYKNKIYARSHLQYWKALMNNKCDIQNLAKTTGRSRWAVRDAMNKDEKTGLIRVAYMKIPGKRGRTAFYSATDKCRTLVRLLEGL